MLTLNNEAESLLDAYLIRINQFCKEQEIELTSTILFGGWAKGYVSPNSDIDIIFVVGNLTSEKKISFFKTYLKLVEVDLGIRELSNGFFTTILDRIGAQYKSVFVCRERDLVMGNTSRIFSSDSFIDSIILDNPIWATDIGLKNILLTAKVVQGREDLFAHLREEAKPIKLRDIKRNYRMYTALAIFGIITYPFSKNATRYSMSSVKWALHSCCFGGFARLEGLDGEISFFKERLADKNTCNTLNQLIQLRSGYRRTLGFNIHALVTVMKIFNYTIKHGKYPIKVNLLT